MAGDPVAALTGQERRVLELIGEGLTNRQIAERMALAEKTAKNLRVLTAGQARHAPSHGGCCLRRRPARSGPGRLNVNWVRLHAGAGIAAARAASAIERGTANALGRMRESNALGRMALSRMA
jgi:Bacterial regulatory proteins, luxR family